MDSDSHSQASPWRFEVPGKCSERNRAASYRSQSNSERSELSVHRISDHNLDNTGGGDYLPVKQMQSFQFTGEHNEYFGPVMGAEGT